MMEMMNSRMGRATRPESAKERSKERAERGRPVRRIKARGNERLRGIFESLDKTWAEAKAETEGTERGAGGGGRSGMAGRRKLR